ncbi:benzoate/H(+) symporter BenE family transporter [Jatrophihabitans sp. YIM 134969]
MERSQPYLAGLITALVGFTSSFTVVLAGLRAVGATERQAASGLLALSVAMGLVAIVMSWRRRIPVSIAWSTPGAALLGATGALSGGYGTAIAAFLLCGVLLLVTGLWPALSRLVAAIPRSLANGLLAGVLLELCLAPVRAVVDRPALAIPVVLVWLALTRLARRWAVPGALVVALVEIGVTSRDAEFGSFAPVLTWTAPHPAFAAVTLGVSLYLVTMAAQNLPGVAVLESFDYEAPLAPALRNTGLATVVAAPFGAIAVNLAAISAALCAGPEGGDDRSRRWIGAATAGGIYIVFGLAAGALSSFIAVAPAVLVEAVAGLALLATLGGALAATVADDGRTPREAGVLTFLVTASGIQVAGIGAPLWGLLAGLVVTFWLRRRPSPNSV